MGECGGQLGNKSWTETDLVGREAPSALDQGEPEAAGAAA